MMRSMKQTKVKVHSSGNALGSLVGDCNKNMNLDQFMPKCMAHVHDLIADMDYNYLDVNLETNLRNYCLHTQEFPKSHGGGDGFLAHVSCKEFAGDLWQARVHELKTSDTSKYKDFCTAFYEHHGGRDAVAKPKKAEPSKYNAASNPSTLLAAIAVCLAFATN